MFFAVAVRAELESRAGGPIARNIGRTYSLTEDEIAYLGTNGVNAVALLAQMNDKQNQFEAARNARNYAEHYVNPSGAFRRPVLTMHGKFDALATVNNESAYLENVIQQGRRSLLVQQFTESVPHCGFTSAQDLAAVNGMVYWLDTGTAPTSAMFPESIGFDSDFVPPAWPK